MAAAKTSIKPYKLKPSGDALTRDDLATWTEVILSFMRQNDTWKPFLPGAAAVGGIDKTKWKSAEEPKVETNGWQEDNDFK